MSEQNRFFYTAPRPIIETFPSSKYFYYYKFINADNYNSLERLIPMIAVLAVASQRILPILNQLYAGHMGNVDATPHTKFVSNFLQKKQINFHIEKI